MVRKITIYRRKLNGFLKIFLSCLLIFVGVIGICFGVRFFLFRVEHVTSPLPLSRAAKNTYMLTAKMQGYCSQYHLSCTAITINTDNSASLTIDSDEHVFFSLQKDLASQFASLQLTIAHLTIEGKRFSRLDFRFDNPVIQYK